MSENIYVLKKKEDKQWIKICQGTNNEIFKELKNEIINISGGVAKKSILVCVQCEDRLAQMLIFSLKKKGNYGGSAETVTPDYENSNNTEVIVETALNKLGLSQDDIELIESLLPNIPQKTIDIISKHISNHELSILIFMTGAWEEVNFNPLDSITPINGFFYELVFYSIEKQQNKDITDETLQKWIEKQFGQDLLTYDYKTFDDMKKAFWDILLRSKEDYNSHIEQDNTQDSQFERNDTDRKEKE